MLVPWPVGVALVSRATTSAESRMSGWEDGAANDVVIAVTATRMERRESIISTIRSLFVLCDGGKSGCYLYTGE